MDVICRKHKEKWFKTLQSCNSHRLPLDLRLDEENHDKLVAFVSGNTQLESFPFWALGETASRRNITLYVQPKHAIPEQ